MQGAEVYYPPVQYSPLWLLLGIGIFLLIAVGYFLIWFLTRKKPQPVEQPRGPWVPQLTPTVRERFIGFIDQVGARHASGETSYVDAHHELSIIVRSFALEARGVRAPYMTLDELKATRHKPLADTIEDFYPGAFSGLEGEPVASAVQRAKSLVSEWK